MLKLPFWPSEGALDPNAEAEADFLEMYMKLTGDVRHRIGHRRERQMK